MNLRNKLIAGLVAAALALGLVRYCDRDRVTPTDPGVLAPNERERVEIKGRTVTVIRADKTTKTYAPNGAKVSIGKDGKVTVTVKKFGLMHEPGLSAAWNGDKLKMALDLKLVYYHRLGLHLGTTYDPTVHKLKDTVRPLAFASYALPSDKLVNTSVWLGAELFPSKYACGIRLAF